MTQTSIELIAQEREKQKLKWSEKHDESHRYGELRYVAAALCAYGTELSLTDQSEFILEDGTDRWGLCEKHKDSSLDRLVIAGALILAEIDRVLKLQPTS